MSGSVLAWVTPFLAWSVALVGCAAAAWAFHVRRLRTRERALVAVVEEREREWAAEREALARLNRQAAEGPSDPAGIERARLLVLTSLERREDIGTRLSSLDMDVDLADSSWSATAACRNAVDAGRPYNLVLLDAILADRGDPGWPDRLQADLAPLGARVAVIRAGARPGGGGAEAGVTPPRHGDGPGAPDEEGTPPHENPDRRGRSGFAAPAAADVAAVGLRSRRGE
jgi:hypothetical protein